ncbi:MAG: hypothetical protein J5I90_05140, partial [Caldilineales bacterium]|nr:hypothetical protein [Caldilineales bacterium]
MFPQKEPASLEVNLDWKRGLGLLLALFLLFGVLGAVVTPDAASDGHSLQPPVVLTPDRWTSLRLARDVRTETETLLQDAARLQQLLDSERPDPIAAML